MRPKEQEQAILATLARLPREGLVLIGGYAVNVYVPPRFSIDCDLVVLGKVASVRAKLETDGFLEQAEGEVPYGSYLRMVHPTQGASFDLMVGSVLDRQSGIHFDRGYFERYAHRRTIVGRVSMDRVRMKVVDPELLFALKFVVGRRQDLRDLFMLGGTDLGWSLIEKILRERCSPSLLHATIAQLRWGVEAPAFRNSLQGSFGKLPDSQFERCSAGLLGGLGSLEEQIPASTQDQAPSAKGPRARMRMS